MVVNAEKFIWDNLSPLDRGVLTSNLTPKLGVGKAWGSNGTENTNSIDNLIICISNGIHLDKC